MLRIFADPETRETRDSEMNIDLDMAFGVCVHCFFFLCVFVHHIQIGIGLCKWFEHYYSAIDSKAKSRIVGNVLKSFDFDFLVCNLCSESVWGACV